MEKMFLNLCLVAMMLVSLTGCVCDIKSGDEFPTAACPDCVLFFDLSLTEGVRLSSDSVDVHLKDSNGQVKILRKNLYFKDPKDPCPHFYLADLRPGIFSVTVYAAGLRAGTPITLTGTSNAVAKSSEGVHVNLLLYDVALGVMPWTGTTDDADF